jgi:hypothetical protein
LLLQISAPMRVSRGAVSMLQPAWPHSHPPRSAATLSTLAFAHCGLQYV